MQASRVSSCRSSSTSAASRGVCASVRRPPTRIYSAAAGVKSLQDGDVVGTKVTLKMPTGLIFAQKGKGEPVTVDEVVPGGAADKNGRIAVGDVLAACSAVVFKSGQSGAEGATAGHGDVLYDKWDRIMFPCAGNEFKVVMDALKSNSPRWGIRDVVLVFQKPGQNGQE
ncbi:hypothetical protein FOA52_002236 [Chlamydomonas sp. UWO 241]|nr:hypothetical protein FOA52_002236 [Chlamydomonas sp. UWO 241]